MRVASTVLACALWWGGCYASHLGGHRDAGGGRDASGRGDADVGLDAGAADDAGVDASRASDAGACIGEAPPWAPPFPVAPSYGPPFCPCASGVLRAVDAWADRRGVFVLVSDEAGATLSQHGTGRWITWSVEPGSAASRVRGIEGGPVWTWPARCSLVRHDAPASAECVALRGHDGAPIAPALADFHPAAMWIVGPRAGDLVTVDRVRDAAVSGTWTLESDADPIDVWGDAVGAFVLTRRQVLGITSAGAGPRSDVPSGEYVALWGVDRDELGVATRDGRLLVFDGTRWREHASGLSSVTHVSRGASTLAVAGERAIGRALVGGGSEVLAEWTEPSVRVVALAASGDLVYAVLVDERTDVTACGGVVVVRFEPDGTARRL